MSDEQSTNSAHLDTEWMGNKHTHHFIFDVEALGNTLHEECRVHYENIIAHTAVMKSLVETGQDDPALNEYLYLLNEFDQWNKWYFTNDENSKVSREQETQDMELMRYLYGTAALLANDIKSFNNKDETSKRLIEQVEILKRNLQMTEEMHKLNEEKLTLEKENLEDENVKLKEELKNTTSNATSKWWMVSTIALSITLAAGIAGVVLTRK